MLKIIKVTGTSLSPEYKDGDFVVIATSPLFLRQLKTGDVIVFRHAAYGTLIKKIGRILPESGEYYVVGTNESSLDSRRLGPIAHTKVTGKVIWHIKK